MYNIIPIVLIVISLAVMAFVVIKKFPQLTMMDISSLPEVKEEKKKDDFIKKRSERAHKKQKQKQREGVQKAMKVFGSVQQKFRGYVTDIYHKVESKTAATNEEQKITTAVTSAPQSDEEDVVSPEKQDKVSNVLQVARQAMEDDKLDIAENKYISAIRLDKKNADAYRGLVDVYMKQGQMQEAKETCQFLLQLHPQDDLAHMRMVDIADEMDDRHVAIRHLKKAIAINDAIAERHFWLSELLLEEKETKPALAAAKEAVERQKENPRFLDNLLKLAIMVVDKKLANETYAQLRLVDPDNSKLGSLKEQIEQL